MDTHKKKDFKVSLVIPAYNEEKYIGMCLLYAIRSGEGKFYEIIVVDNKSTDRTAEIAGRYEGVRIVREENKGLTHARQRGFLEAKGDILAYIDADTRMPSGYYEKVVQEFENDPDLACFSGPHEYYDIKESHQLLVKIFWKVVAFPAYLIVGYMTIGVNFAIRKDVLEKMGGFDTAITFYGEDTDIARRAHAHGKVKFSTKFGMPTSGRRLTHHGVLYTGFVYMANFFSEIVLKKPVTMKYKDIR